MRDTADLRLTDLQLLSCGCGECPMIPRRPCSRSPAFHEIFEGFIEHVNRGGLFFDIATVPELRPCGGPSDGREHQTPAHLGNVKLSRSYGWSFKLFHS